MKTFLVTALEASANLHLKEVLKALSSEFSKARLESSAESENGARLENSVELESVANLEICGIYDESLCKEFAFMSKPLYSSHEFSAMGFVEVLPLIFKAKRAIKELTHLALQGQNSNLNPQNENFAPSNAYFQVAHNEGKMSANSSQIQKPSKPFDAVLCIDSPAFNIPLARSLNSAGIKAKKIYYILPQVWAWKRGRVPIIEANFDTLASILPFDKHFFSKSTFVGHPLLDELKEFKNEADIEALLNKEEDEKVVSFLPGSRKGEIKRLMPVFRDLALNFKGEKILCVPPFNIDKLDALYGDTSAFKVVTNTPQALKKSDFAFICSGTATLEAALIGTPFVLAYKARAIDVLIARFFVKLKHIGLANIMCDFEGKTELNPEFLQNEVSAKNLFEAYRNFDFKEFFDKVTFLKKYLRFGAAKNVAKMLKG